MNSPLNRFLVFLIIVLSTLTVIVNVNQKPVAKPEVLSSQTVAINIIPTQEAISLSPSKPLILTPTPTESPKAKSLVQVPQVQAETVNAFCLTVPVLLYHHIQPMEQAYKNGNQNLTVTPEYFETQMRYLAEHGYKTIPAHDLVQALLEKKQLLEKSIIITLDDAYADAFTYAFPIFRKYNVIGNIMVPTGLMQGVNYLTWDQLREITGSGLVFAYNHTWSHASLSNLPAEQIEQEVLTAQQQLANQLGKAYSLISYPYGAYDDNVIAILKKHGFQAGFSTIHGTRQCDSDLMHLYRIHIGNSDLPYYGL